MRECENLRHRNFQLDHITSLAPLPHLTFIHPSPSRLYSEIEAVVLKQRHSLHDKHMHYSGPCETRLLRRLLYRYQHVNKAWDIRRSSRNCRVVIMHKGRRTHATSSKSFLPTDVIHSRCISFRTSRSQIPPRFYVTFPLSLKTCLVFLPSSSCLSFFAWVSFSSFPLFIPFETPTSHR